MALAVHASRVRRDRHFPPKLFGEPAWDILLDLFANSVEGKRISISSACLAANVPHTTALRYIRELERVGLVARMPSLADSRVTLLHMTDRGMDAMRGAMGIVLGAAHGVIDDRFRSDSICLGDGESDAASGRG